MDEPTNTILIADEDSQVLGAVERALSGGGDRLRTAGDGEEALAALTDALPAVLICGPRLGGMSGVELLGEARSRCPDTYRIMLLDGTDAGQTRAAVGSGAHQLLPASWEAEHLRAAVATGAGHARLLAENRRLAEQNEQLRREQQQHERSLQDSAIVMAGMLEAYDPAKGVHSKRVARNARWLARRLETPPEQLKRITFAAYLHDVGKISRLSCERSGEKGTIRHYEAGYAILRRVNGFEKIAEAVRHQQEWYDGAGRPDGLAGEQIPLAARIVAVANAYDKAVHDPNDPTQVRPERGRNVLQRGSGVRFDPVLVDLLVTTAEDEQPYAEGEVEMSAKQVRPGMTLSREVTNAKGLLMLKAGTELTESMVAHLRAQAYSDMLLSSIYVRSTTRGEAEEQTEGVSEANAV